MSDAAYHVGHQLRRPRFEDRPHQRRTATALAGGAPPVPAPFGAVVVAAAGYYSSERCDEVRNHWFDVVAARRYRGRRVVQTAVLLQMRLIVLAADPVADLVREVRVGYRPRACSNAASAEIRSGRPMVEPSSKAAAAGVRRRAPRRARGRETFAARNESLAKILQGCWEGSMAREIGRGGEGRRSELRSSRESPTNGEDRPRRR